MRWIRRREGRSESASTPVAHMRRALHLVLAGDLAAAEVVLAEAARADSSASDVYLALANIYRSRGGIGRAVQIHQNLLLREDLSGAVRREALLGLALDFRAGGFLRRASASFEELLEVDPDNLRALTELERIRVESSDWEQAIRIRRRIGTADPATPKILAHLWSGLGRARAKAGMEVQARKAFKRAFSHDQDCAEAYIALGDLRLGEQKTRKAIGLWQRALPLHPAIGVLLYSRFWEAHVALDDLPGLDTLLRKRLGAEPDDLEAALWLARVAVRQGQIDEALAVLHRLLNREPGYLAGYAELGRVLLGERRDLEAGKALEELLERLPVERRRLSCQSCGTQDTDLHWRCPQCGEWDSFV